MIRQPAPVRRAESSAPICVPQAVQGVQRPTGALSGMSRADHRRHACADACCDGACAPVADCELAAGEHQVVVDGADDANAVLVEPVLTQIAPAGTDQSLDAEPFADPPDGRQPRRSWNIIDRSAAVTTSAAAPPTTAPERRRCRSRSPTETPPATRPSRARSARIRCPA